MKSKPPIPVTRGARGVLWQGQKASLDQFSEIREYIDACMAPSKAPVTWKDRLCLDFALLKGLVKELEKIMPRLDSSEWSEALPVIPPPPTRPLALNRTERFASPIFLKTLHCHRAYGRFLADYKRYEAQRKDWETLNSDHLRAFRLSAGSKFKARDLPGKPTPPPPVSKFGDLPDNLRGVFHSYLKARIDQAAKIREWRKSTKEYADQLQEMIRRHGSYKNLKAHFERHSPKQRYIDRLLKDLERLISDGGLIFESLRWKILPAGPVQTDLINRHLNASQKRFPKRQFDDTRIKKVLTLKPSQAYVGTDEFDGYMVFLFQGCRFAVLECPWFGNALYMLNGDWNALSKLSKSDLLSQHRSHARRIIHDDDGTWFHQLKREISANSVKPKKT